MEKKKPAIDLRPLDKVIDKLENRVTEIEKILNKKTAPSYTYSDILMHIALIEKLPQTKDRSMEIELLHYKALSIIFGQKRVDDLIADALKR